MQKKNIKTKEKPSSRADAVVRNPSQEKNKTNTKTKEKLFSRAVAGAVIQILLRKGKEKQTKNTREC
jgi:hypothetical protein